ncbi:hypothetical protein MASR1M97_04810 [Candidatus Desulfobacillus denitrificans]
MPAMGVASLLAISLKPGGSSVDLVAVAHPDVEQAVALGIGAVLDACQQLGVAAGAKLRIAEFALFSSLDLAAELFGHGLHAVADAEHRHAQFEHDLGCLEGFLFIDRVRPPGQDDADRRELADEGFGHIVGMQLAIDLLLAARGGRSTGCIATRSRG